MIAALKAMLGPLLALPARVATLEKKCAELAEELETHVDEMQAVAHTRPFWREYNRRQLTRYDECMVCGFRWEKGLPEAHFNDATTGEHCPRLKAT